MIRLVWMSARRAGPDSDQRIKDYNPNMKVLLIIRDPEEWALSFTTSLHRLITTVPFSEFVKAMITRLATRPFM